MDERALLKLAVAFSAHVDRSTTTVAKWVGVHSRLFRRLEDGQGCHTSTLREVANWFDQNWPDDLEWPQGVDRPSVVNALKKEALS